MAYAMQLTYAAGISLLEHFYRVDIASFKKEGNSENSPNLVVFRCLCKHVKSTFSWNNSQEYARI